jgi:hypothetical protein
MKEFWRYRFIGRLPDNPEKTDWLEQRRRRGIPSAA